MNFGLEVSGLPEKGEQELPIPLNIRRIERRLVGVVRDLDQSGIVETLRTRKLENAKVHGGFKNEQKVNAIGAGIHLGADILELPSGLESGDGLINFCF